MNAWGRFMCLIPISWNELLHVVLKLSRKIRDVDYIVGIKRGGVIPAVLIGASLGISEIGFIQLKRYSDDKPPRELYDRPRVLKTEIGNVQGKIVLLVDDLARTGKTLIEAEKLLKNMGAKKVFKAVIVLKKNALFKPDFYGLLLDKCPYFPWEDL